MWLITRSAATRTPSGVERAQAILAERLARGEISPEEYRTTLTHLQ
ncbi:MAG: SHOCT domain-containing protein [Acidimicrobiia bacterium]|nr:SHOCT domain-containing protein [Acidimicrobiia bacterium]